MCCEEYKKIESNTPEIYRGPNNCTMTLSNLETIRLVDRVPYAGEAGAQHIKNHCFRFLSHDGIAIGTILAFVAEHLKQFPDVLAVDDAAKTVSISPTLKSVEERNAGLAKVANALRESGRYDCLKGWRDELYTIYNPSHVPYALIERSVSAIFGVVTYGVHIVGYVPSKDGSKENIKIWVPRRSWKKPTYPGMLDNTVAGGIGYPHGIEDTAIKECYEEAGLEEEYVRNHLQPTGVVTYYFRETDQLDHEKGFFQPEVEFTFDLILEEGVIPHPVDGEVHEFNLWDVAEVKKQLALGSFKYNTALITIDFFVRHGLITPQEEPNYTEIAQRCHRLLEFPLM